MMLPEGLIMMHRAVLLMKQRGNLVMMHLEDLLTIQIVNLVQLQIVLDFITKAMDVIKFCHNLFI